MPSGNQRSVLNGNLKPSGITPITVVGTSLMRMRAADDRRVAAVAVHPHAVPDQHHCGRAGPVVVGSEAASEYRLLADAAES